MRLTNKKNFADKSRDTFIVIAVCLVSLSASVIAFFYEKQRNYIFAQNQFEEEISIVERNLRQTFDAYAQVLRSGVSLFRTTEGVDRQIWQNYIANLQLEENYPGIQGMSFNALLHSKADLDAYEAMIQQTDLPSFTVRPGGDQDHYAPIVYLEPSVGRNRVALGFDIYSEANRREAINRAVATNEPSMTSKITLVQDDDDDGVKAGVLVVLPIFPHDLDPAQPKIEQAEGVIVSVFRIRDLMETILRDDAGQSTMQRKYVALHEVSPDGEILDMYLPDLSDNHDAKYQAERTFEMYGKTWRIAAQSSSVFEDENEQNSHFTILLAGGLVTLFLTLTVAALAGRNREILASAEALGKSNAQIALLMKEVNHRSKNLLGLVQAIARQTSAGNPDAFAESFGRRLSSLSASQDLLVKNKWQDIELTDLLESQLAYFDDLLGKRIILSGPLTYLDAANAQTLSMAIHELTTNATKYGALSNETGTVNIDWNCEPGPPEKTFFLNWVEKGGPPVNEPDKKGFGSKVTGVMVQMSLEAEIERKFASEGFSWHLSCPHRKLSAKTDATYGGIGGAHDLSKRVLIVEDDVMLAIDLAEQLIAFGYEVVGPCMSSDQALRVFDEKGCDVAVLDISLGIETSEPVAHRLGSANVPFVIASGYSDTQWPSVFKGKAAVNKPYSAKDVAELIEEVA